jgi:hypothetical protein
MICTTAVLSLVLVAVLLSKAQSCCNRSKASKSGPSDLTVDEHYDELDEHVQASELQGNFLFGGMADAKIAFDKSQQRYHIEFSAKSSCSSGDRGIFRCQNCAVKESCASAASPLQEKKTENNYIVPSLGNAEEPAWNALNEDTQSVYLGCKENLIQGSVDNTYLIATTGAQNSQH